ncbi:MAG TPA: glycosyltransferase [Rhodothermales bacterium]|nr:glycosyltransferase [Rhodothermales bacterium]
MDRPLRVLAWPADGNRTGNPYNALLAEGLRARGVTVDEFTPRRLFRGRYDVWHAHWPEGGMGRGGTVRALAGAAMTLALALWARARGTSVMWTVHNLKAHDAAHPQIERAFWRAWARAVDGSLHLSEVGRHVALTRFPALRGKPSFVVPHPHYRTAYPAAPPKAEARARLGLPPDARVLVFVGHVAPYKNVPALVRAFRDLDASGTRLVVAGRPSTEALGQEVQEAAGDDSRVVLRLHRLTEADLATVIGAADVVALPYAEVLNSGAALLALSLDRPVLVPAAGSMTDLRAALGPDWVRLFDAPLDAADLADTLAAVTRPDRPTHAPLDRFAPDAVAADTLAVYRVMVGGADRRREG